MSRQPVYTLLIDDEEHLLPGKFQVCTRCRGVGMHVNPAVDGNGISPDEFAQDPDFEESYFRGDYDVQCEACHGERVVAVPDLARWSFAQKRALVLEKRVQREMAREDYSERFLRMAENGF